MNRGNRFWIDGNEICYGDPDTPGPYLIVAVVTSSGRNRAEELVDRFNEMSVFGTASAITRALGVKEDE